MTDAPSVTSVNPVMKGIASALLVSACLSSLSCTEGAGSLTDGTDLCTRPQGTVVPLTGSARLSVNGVELDRLEGAFIAPELTAGVWKIEVFVCRRQLEGEAYQELYATLYLDEPGVEQRELEVLSGPDPIDTFTLEFYRFPGEEAEIYRAEPGESLTIRSLTPSEVSLSFEGGLNRLFPAGGGFVGIELDVEASY